MTTDIEALRAQFERHHGSKRVQRDHGGYVDPITRIAWRSYQAGHAAAKSVELAEEVERLKAANQDLRDWFDAAEANAKRYRFLRMNRLWLKANLPMIAAGEFDAAIDAAMKGGAA